MDGFLPSENMRFRDYSLSFNISDKDEEEIKSIKSYSYPKMMKSFDNKFRLCIESGGFSDSEIIVLLGENGTGKTTLIQLLAGKLQADDSSGEEIPELGVSYKPQKISPKFEGTVRDLLMARIRDAAVHQQFISDVIKPLDLPRLFDRQVNKTIKNKRNVVINNNLLSFNCSNL